MNYVDLLRRMSFVEAKIFDYACGNCIKKLFPNNAVFAAERNSDARGDFFARGEYD